MSASPIPVSTARTMIPFMDFMNRIGAPVDRWLEQCRLPMHLYENPDTPISTVQR